MLSRLQGSASADIKCFSYMACMYFHAVVCNPLRSVEIPNYYHKTCMQTIHLTNFQINAFSLLLLEVMSVVVL